MIDVARQFHSSAAYVVGGTVRDLLIGRSSNDLDLAVEGAAAPFANRLSKALGGRLVTLDDATKVYRIILPAGHGPWKQIDVAQVQGKDIHQDLLRRDFTINAMAWSLDGGALLDPRGGLGDLKSKILRADRPEVFRDDPLRLLRAFRQAAQLGFSIDAATLRHIRKFRKLATKPAGERIRQELLSLLIAPDFSHWLQPMDQSGLLTTLFPELERSRRCAVEYYGKGGVLRHLFDASARMDFLLAHLDRTFPEFAADIQAHLSWENAKPLLRLAIFLHDIAKPATAKKVGGRLRFFGHDEMGAKLASKFLSKYRFSNDELSFVSTCILHHLRPGNLAANESISDKAAFRFFRDVGRHGVALLLVCWADHASYLSPAEVERVLPHASKDPHGFEADRIREEGVRKTLHHLQVVSFLLRSFFRRRETVQPTKLISGNEVMKALKIPPGPEVGRILGLLQEAQAEGKVRDRRQAIEFVKKTHSLARP